MCGRVFLAYLSLANIMKISENRAKPNKYILLNSNIQKKQQQQQQKKEIRKSQNNKKPLMMIKIRSR